MSTRHQSVPFAEKILSRDDLVARYGPGRSTTVVFTNGCFDILHRGHVEYLAKARDLGDELVVGLNTDRSVRQLKGSGRPVNPEQDRAMVLAALEAVTAVTLFDEETPLELVGVLRPDVIVKGGDYTEEQVVGADIVRASGGRVAILPLVPGRSTTSILERSRSQSHDTK